MAARSSYLVSLPSPYSSEQAGIHGSAPLSGLLGTFPSRLLAHSDYLPLAAGSEAPLLPFVSAMALLPARRCELPVGVNSPSPHSSSHPSSEIPRSFSSQFISAVATPL